MRSAITAAVCLLALACVASALPAPADERLGAEMVDMLLGEWVLQDTTARVPTAENPSGVAYMTGQSINGVMRKLANSSNLASMDNAALSEELQKAVVGADTGKLASSTIAVVSANPVTGAVIIFNVSPGRNNTQRSKRLMGFASRTTDLDNAPVVEFVGGEQPTPAEWSLRWSQAAGGEWQMSAQRLQGFQINDGRRRNATVLERQSLLTMSPYLKTNNTLADLYPAIVGTF